MSRYKPPFVSQFDGGSKWDGYNCGYTSLALAIDKATEGARRPGPNSLRRAAGDTVLDPATVGSTLTELQKAADLLAPGTVRTFGLKSERFFWRMKRGRGAVVNIEAGVLPRRYRGSKIKDFEGLHSIYFSHVNRDGLRVLVYDPGDTKPRWMPIEVFVAAAVAYRDDGRIWGLETVLPREPDPEPLPEPPPINPVPDQPEVEQPEETDPQRDALDLLEDAEELIAEAREILEPVEETDR
jgi:hypothetical protein